MPKNPAVTGKPSRESRNKLSAAAATAALWLRRFQWARVAVIAEVSFILMGWGLAQFPNLITPDVTVYNSAAPPVTLRLLIVALGTGAVILLPSLYYLFHVFKGKESTVDSDQ